jgi:PITH domain
MDECTGHDHDHEHDHDDLGLSLRPHINMDGVSCLNELTPGMGRSILKLHEDRLSSTPLLQSQEDDPELLLYIPFTEAVTIKTIAIRSVPPPPPPASSNDGDEIATAPPFKIKLFVDRDNLDFETARELTPQVELTCVPPNHFVDGTIDYPLRPAGRFQNISSLTIFVVSNFASVDGDGDDNDDDDDKVSTVITYIGLKGQGSKMKRRAVEAVYESRGMPADHKVKGEFNMQEEVPDSH